MEKVLSPYEKFILERDKKIIELYENLREAGTAKMASYREIGGSLYPPLDPTAVLRVLKKHGLNQEQSKFGRPQKKLISA